MIPSPMNPTAWSAMPTTSRRLDPQRLTARQATARLRRQLLAIDQVAALRAGFAALRSRRSVAAALGEQRVVHVRERLELADHAVAASVASAAARAASHRVRGDAERELQLERLDRRVERV